MFDRFWTPWILCSANRGISERLSSDQWLLREVDETLLETGGRFLQRQRRLMRLKRPLSPQVSEVLWSLDDPEEALASGLIEELVSLKI